MPHRASRLSMALAPALILGGLVFGVSGCTQFPEVHASVSDEMANKPYPDLVPIHTLRARIDSPTLTPQNADAVAARADALRSRAAALKRREAVDAQTRARMERGVR
ncbi:hypothetical protein [Roseovarius sp.]|uniref:hypothetical protein n=1 Tax=Roseovarius sp. TaxID=1486281 RepID=UPI0035132CFE